MAAYKRTSFLDSVYTRKRMKRTLVEEHLELEYGDEDVHEEECWSGKSVFAGCGGNVTKNQMFETGDYVMVSIPDELEILQQVDASLHGRIAQILSIEGDEVEVYVPGLSSKSKNKEHTTHDSTFLIPMFCLSMSDSMFESRMKQFYSSSKGCHIPSSNNYENKHRI
jgi:hypothetical protein